jgi:hypothetical protein
VVPFDDSAAAGFYSQLTGVLAGFAFAGLIFMLTKRQDPEEPQGEQANGALLLLLASFLGLTVTSLAYAVIGGEKSGAAGVEHVFAGLGFAASAVALLLAVLELVGLLAAALEPVIWFIVVRLVPIVGVLYVVAGAFATGARQYLTLVSVLSVVALGLPFSGWWSTKGRPHAPADLAYCQRVTWWVMGISLVQSILVPTISAFAGLGFIMPAWIVVFPLCGTGIAALVLTTTYGRTSEAEAGLSHSSQDSRSEPDKAVAPDAVAAKSVPPSADGARRPVIEPEIDAHLLAAQARDIFPAGYQTSVSVIQGVALSFLVAATLQANESGEELAALLLRATMTLLGITLVAYGYLWFTAIIRWPVTWLDIAVPYALGISEIFVANSVADESKWWVALAVFGSMGSLAYLNTRLHVGRIRFGRAAEQGGARDVMQRLLASLVLATAGVAAVSLGLLWLTVDDRADWLQYAGPAGLCVAALGIAARTQQGLHDFFEACGVERPGWLGSPARRMANRTFGPLPGPEAAEH